ncbi:MULTISPECIES: porin [Rahnella]|jgi:predicted porin|uniref:Porin n=1 Tax=Rahnella sp. (strain Y9602) TaxID=2703885 RepID=A0A0H3FAW6_RAHSY|nr:MULTISPECIES: porin [Rahnella]AFE58686.1 porin [Rahnella aquatilis HX2]AYA07327.1 porin [Rahnella aquatilis]ADW74039.1 porin Gram-negative type [Rahnella aceris]AZP42530.1 porin [Rahnella aquatilis]AZP46870.1 porin [Rahnella aquatilis]
MMKRSVLALAVSLIAVGSTANASEIYNKDGNKLDLYGRVTAKHYFSDDKSSDGDMTYARLGFKGETQINDTLTGYGQWEYNIQANHAESQGDLGNKTRLGFAGLKVKDFGSIDFGRNYGVVYDALGFTDMLPEFGGDTANNDNFMVGRSSGLATYRNQDFFGLVTGLNIALQYQGKNENDGRSASKGNGDGYGASIDYEDIAGSGIGAVIAGSSSDRTNAQTNATIGAGDKASAWATGLKYDAHQIYLAAMYNETRNQAPVTVGSTSGYANKTQGYELVAQYQFENGLRPSIGYVQSKAKDVEGVGDADLVKYFEIGATYYFNKNMYTYVDYMINQIDDNNKLGVSSDDIVAVALTYRF